MRQKYFLLYPLAWSLMSLLMLISFIILQQCVKKIVVLGNITDDYEWLRNSNYLSPFVRPDNRTGIIVPTRFSSFRQRDEIVCFVMSTPEHRLARSIIRFVVNEAKVFNDIIVEDFTDSDMNLTIKTAFAMKHFLRHFASSKYFLKIDDDVLLNVDNFYAFLREANFPENSIIGGEGKSAKPHRDKESKLYMPHWLYGDKSFPPYIDGQAYLISGEFWLQRLHLLFKHPLSLFAQHTV